MNATLQRFLDAHSGVVPWRDACAATSVAVVEWASRSGQVRLAYPGVLVDPECGDNEDIRLRAVLACAGPGAAISHTSALAIWLPVSAGSDIHVMTAPGRRIRVPGIVGHRRRGFVAEPPAVLTRRGFPVTALETTLIDSWPHLTGDGQRAPALLAISERMTTAARIRNALVKAPNVPQRRGLGQLLDRLDAGCRSSLELWGYDHVFTGPGFDQLRWQYPIKIGNRTFWLDAFDEESATDFELDGAKYHSSDRARERDLRRDAQLAKLGIQPIRFTHHRLTHEIASVRDEALAIMEVRRRAAKR